MSNKLENFNFSDENEKKTAIDKLRKMIVNEKSDDIEQEFLNYSVMENRAAGDAYIQIWADDDDFRSNEGHFTEIARCDTREEAEKVIDEIKGETKYVLFVNRPAGEVFVSEEDGLSGNWRGSKYSNFNCYGEYDSREEAVAEMKRYKEYFEKIENERGR